MKTVCSAVVMFLTAVLLSACGGAATPTPGLSLDFNDNNLTVSGTADTVTAGVTLQVAGSDAIRAYTSVLEPAEGTATLLTTPLDPDGSGTVRAIAIATGRQSVGAAATSTIVFAGFAGFAFENIVDIGPNNKQALMGRLLDY